MKTLTIIVAYNFMPWIDRCLGSLRLSEVKTDVMVLDNASTDDTVATIRREYPEVMLIENGQNLGFGRANNIGMRYAIEKGYDSVLLLNQDAWIDANVLQLLANASAANPAMGILSPIHLTGKGDKVERGFGIYSGITDLRCQPRQPLVQAKFIDAAIWFIPVRVLKAVGLFAPIFYHYGEDKDMANRMLYHGYGICYLPNVYGYHDREQRQVTRSGFFRAERVYFLSEYANINYSFAKAFAMGVLAIGKKAIVALFHLSLRNAASYCAMGFRLFLRTREIIESRRMAKNVDLNYYK